MTGWWQINNRGQQPMYLHVEDDLGCLDWEGIVLKCGLRVLMAEEVKTGAVLRSKAPAPLMVEMKAVARGRERK